MRAFFALACLFAMMLAELPVISAQPDEDYEEEDDDGDNEANHARILAQQLADSSSAPDFTGPAEPDTQPSVAQASTPQEQPPAPQEQPPAPQMQPPAPQEPLPELPAAPAKASTPVSTQTANTSHPAPVNMVTSLDSFGAASLNRFGQQHFAAPAPAPASPVETTKAEPTKEAQVVADAKNAHVAAETAKNAAEVANKVAVHSVKLTEHAKSALKDAQNALHKARVDTKGLSDKQRHSLKKAEAKLKEATKSAAYGEVKNAKYVKAEVENKDLQKLEKKMDTIKKESKKKKESNKDELEAMRKEIEGLRKELKKKEGEKDDSDALLQELQDSIKEMEKSDKKEDKATKKSHDEMKAEIERLRAEIDAMEDDKGNITYTVPAKVEQPVKKAPAKPVQPEAEEEEVVEKYNVKKNLKPLRKEEKEEEEEEEEVQERSQTTPVRQKGIDIDTSMPYGDLEPFGREDTAQELTENSIAESDEMVDTIERAEVAEEKRSVFRALTRLRGAAITSFDGVARSQSGNIDEYNKIHKWRNTHPLHHLADEESDVSKWAFPDNAD